YAPAELSDRRTGRMAREETPRHKCKLVAQWKLEDVPEHWDGRAGHRPDPATRWALQALVRSGSPGVWTSRSPWTAVPVVRFVVEERVGAGTPDAPWYGGHPPASCILRGSSASCGKSGRNPVLSTRRELAASPQNRA